MILGKSANYKSGHREIGYSNVPTHPQWASSPYAPIFLARILGERGTRGRQFSIRSPRIAARSLLFSCISSVEIPWKPQQG
jgi:hypothetical protein